MVDEGRLQPCGHMQENIGQETENYSPTTELWPGARPELVLVKPGAGVAELELGTVPVPVAVFVAVGAGETKDG